MHIQKRWLALAVICFATYYLLTNYKAFTTHYLTQATYKVRQNPIILFYTTWNVMEYWLDLYPERLENYLEDVNCPVNNCKISYDKNKITEATAVLFHAQDLTSAEMYSPDNLKMLPRPDLQRWIWVNQESPLNVKGIHFYNGMFNWTATYHRNSDIFLPYGSYIVQHTEHKEHKMKMKKLLKQKKRLIAWAVSDCGGLREKYALKLQNYLDITVFGKCNERYKHRGVCMKKTAECRRNLLQYKFYLSFENSICEDYVTEKYWENALLHSSVPIVFGANYDKKVAIPGSYIDIKKFKSINSFVKYISFLDKNNDAYLKYFDWKRKYKSIPTEDLLCKICKKLHGKTLHPKVYNDLGQFWSKEKYCSSYDYVQTKVRKQLGL